MQSANEKSSNQQSFFYVVWPEEASLVADSQIQVTIPSPSQSAEQGNSEMEISAIQDPAATSEQPLDSLQETIITSSVLLPSTVETPVIATTSPQSSSNPSKLLSSQQSPLKIFRPVATTIQQITELPATLSTQSINLTENPQVFLKGLQNKDTRTDGVRVSSPPKQRELPSPPVTVVSTPPGRTEGEDDDLRMIGIFAEKATANIQNILKIASKSQTALKPASTKEQPTSEDSTNSPAAKRFCLWDTGTCMECTVKEASHQAEVQVLRKTIQQLQEYILMLNQRTQLLLSTGPLLPNPVDSSRAQHSSAKQIERQRGPPNQTPVHVESPFQRSEQRNRKISEARSSSSKAIAAAIDPNQPGTSKGELTELVPGSGVYILSRSLMEARKDARSGTQLARKLMDLFWDKDTLAKSTLTPKSKFQYQQLEPKIIKAIEAYCLQYDDAVHSRDIHATMTDKCCQARSRIRTLQPDTEITKKSSPYPMH